MYVNCGIEYMCSSSSTPATSNIVYMIFLFIFFIVHVQKYAINDIFVFSFPSFFSPLSLSLSLLFFLLVKDSVH